MTLASEFLRDCQPSFLKPFFEKWTICGIAEKEHLRRHGGIPGSGFCFGLCEKQKQFIEYLFRERRIENPTVEKSRIFSAYFN
jgi:hypothetical protein